MIEMNVTFSCWFWWSLGKGVSSVKDFHLKADGYPAHESSPSEIVTSPYYRCCYYCRYYCCFHYCCYNNILIIILYVLFHINSSCYYCSFGFYCIWIQLSAPCHKSNWKTIEMTLTFQWRVLMQCYSYPHPIHLIIHSSIFTCSLYRPTLP